MVLNLGDVHANMHTQVPNFGRYKTQVTGHRSQVTGHKTCGFAVSSYFGSYLFTS